VASFTNTGLGERSSANCNDSVVTRAFRAPAFTSIQFAFTLLGCLCLLAFHSPALVVVGLVVAGSLCVVPIIRCLRIRLVISDEKLLVADLWRTVELRPEQIDHFEAVSVLPFPPVVITPFTAVAVVAKTGRGWPIYATCLRTERARDELFDTLGRWAHDNRIPFRLGRSDLSTLTKQAQRRYPASWKT
jgi:hypothetical protein